MTEFLNQYGFLLVQMLFAALMGLSLYLPLMAGQLSLASPGFYAIGGYIAAVMSTRPDVFPTSTLNAFPLEYVLVEMVVAGVICGILAVIIGVPALRLRGIYFALATIAFVEIVRVLSLNLEITGKAVGIFNVPQPFSNRFDYIIIALPMLLICMVLFYRLERTRVGRAFIAIREDELAASAMGISPTFYKVLAFMLGAILAGMVGAANAHFLNTWNARQGTFDAGILYLAFVIIGGSRTFLGAVLGGLILTALPEFLRALGNIDGIPAWLEQFLKDGRLIIYGFLITLSTQFFPQGLLTPDMLTRLKKFILRRQA